jgi:membrane-bound serine protease (ClpP class)
MILPGFRAILLGCCIAATAALLSATPAAAPALPPQSSEVVELRIDGDIEPVLAEYIVGGIEAAGRSQASLILITMNTPGGLDSSMRSIIQSIINSPVPVAIYVGPSGSRAASAGFFILLSGDVAAMAPGTDTGAASPLLVLFGSPVQIDETLRHKIVNEATAYLRSFASKRGRNVDLAEKAVTEAKAFSEKEALEGKLIDLVVSSPEGLLAQLDGRTITRFDGTTKKLALGRPQIVTREMSARQKFLSRIVQPDVLFILLIVGVLGLYAEFTHPGLVAPGVIGGIALLLALFSMHMLPVNLTGLLLIALALILFILEAKFPSHGVLGVGGAVAMVLGALMLIRSPLTGMGVSLGAALGVTLPVAAIIIFLMRLVLRSRQWKQSTGAEQLVGVVGQVTEPIEGKGMVLVHGELWRAVAAQRIPKGAQVRVRRVDGLTLNVEPLDPASGTPPAAAT